jgi:hypothetical protein
MDRLLLVKDGSVVQLIRQGEKPMAGAVASLTSVRTSK